MLLIACAVALVLAPVAAALLKKNASPGYEPITVEELEERDEQAMYLREWNARQAAKRDRRW